MKNGSTTDRERNREGFYDDYWHTAPKQPAESADPRVRGAVDRETYYAKRDAYYAERDAYYAERDAYYARQEAPEADDEYEYEYEDAPDGGRAKRTVRRRKRRRRRSHPFRVLLTLLIIAGLAAMLLGTPPMSNALGERLSGRSAVLLIVVAEDGRHTDSVMLVTFEQKDHRVRTLTLPADMVAEDGAEPRVDGAYALGGVTELMRLAEDLLGFPPDGYFLLDGEWLHRAGELAGLPAGGGFSGGADDVLAALQRLLSPSSLRSARELWRLFRARTRTDLTVRNLFWVARVLVKADLGKMPAEALPGRLVVREDSAYRTVDRPAAAQVLKDYSPFI